MSEENVSRKAVEETQGEPSTTDQPGAGPPAEGSRREEQQQDSDREQSGDG